MSIRSKISGLPLLRHAGSRSRAEIAVIGKRETGLRARLTTRVPATSSYGSGRAGDAKLAKKSGNSLRGFAIFVLLPSLLALIYVGLVQTPQFITESRFVIRSATEQKGALSDTLSVLSKIGGGGNSKSTTQDGFIATDYVRGRTIVMDLGGRNFMEKRFSAENIDVLSRLKADASFEDIWKYWNKHITASLDTISGVVTLRVQAFTANDAMTINQSVLDLCERLINRISERMRNDSVTRSANELDLARERLIAAKQNLLNFRNRNLLIDPVAKATSIGEVIAKLTIKRIEIESQLNSLANTLSATSPTQRLVSDQLQVVDRQIMEQRQLLAGAPGTPRVSGEINEFEQLKLTEFFNQRLYEIAQSSYEKARQDAERQQLFLATVVAPTLPEEALIPRVGVDAFLVFAFSLVCWSIASLIIASVREHVV